MTKEEADQYYRMYMRRYESASAQKRAAEKYANEIEANKRKSENSLSAYNTQKKNLELRLEDIKEIIGLFDNTLTLKITSANKSSQKAGERYISAINCNLMKSADVNLAFFTKSVTEDLNSNDSYQRCVSEKNRLETDIENLRQKISSLNNTIAFLNSQIRSYNAAASSYACNMRSSLSQADYYRRYR